MSAVGTSLDVIRLQRELTTSRYGRSLSYLLETGSTNDDARQALTEHAANGHVVVADAQRAGRGSRGRAWESPAGTDLYVSILDRLPVALADLPPLTLAIGLAVADTCDALLHNELRSGRPSQVKWPNDVLVSGKKCAGVLVETSIGRSEHEGVVIGIGLNVNREQFQPELLASATSLRLVKGGMAIDRTTALCTLLTLVEQRVDQFVSLGSASIARELTPRLAYVGQRVACQGEQGILRGVADHGALLLETAHGLRSVVVGPVEPLP